MGKNLRVLVTGGAGFIGSHLCDALLASGHQVVAIDNLSSGNLDNLSNASSHPGFEFRKGTVLDPELMEKSCRKADVVYHLAVECVRLSIGRPLENHAVNATGTLAALEAARRMGVKRFVYCSSSEVYGNTSDQVLSEATTIPEPVTVYGAAKLAGELYTKAYRRTYGMDTLVVRPFNAYGPREHYEGMLAEVIPKFIIRALNGLSPIIYGDGSNARDFTYVSDTVSGIIAAGESGNFGDNVVNIAYGRAVSVKVLAETILTILGRTDLSPQYIEPRPGDVLNLHADTKLAAGHLGFHAQVKLEEGLARTIDWFKTKFPDPAHLLGHDLERAWTEAK